MVTAKKTTATTAEVAPKSKTPAKKSAAVTAPVPAAAAPKVAVKKSPAKKAAPAKAKASAAPAAARPAVTVEQRHNYIEVAAFYVAQRRGFAPGNPIEDWAMAEQEVDRLIASGHFSK